MSIGTIQSFSKASIDSIIRRSNSISYFHCLAGNLRIIFQQFSLFLVCKVFRSRSSTVRVAMFTCRVTSLITCIQFRLLIKEYLNNWYQFWIDWYTVIFSEHFG